MYLRVRRRKKNGKTHRYWSIVESRRASAGRIIQKQLLYLGELNDAQHAGWIQAIKALHPASEKAQQLALFPDDVRVLPTLDYPIVQIRIDQIRLAHPRQWGACWLVCQLWDMLKLDGFWRQRLEVSRKGTDWLCVLKTLVAYRLIDPGSEFRLHRQWFDQSAMSDLLNTSPSIASKNTLYRCLDHLLEHRDALFSHLTQQWRNLFNARYDVLLYDLTSTYFECDPPETSDSKKRFGYSRDRRPDCVQVVIGLVVTPQGFPLGYEIFPGNTRDTSTLRTFLDRIESQYGKLDRVWLMDRGIPTEETLEQMRTEGALYLVGTPKGRLSKLEKQLLQLPWHQARQQVRVKLLETEGEFYLYVESLDRLNKERSMRRRRLKRLLTRLQEIQQIKKQTRDELLLRLGEARKLAGRTWYLIDIQLPDTQALVSSETFRFHLSRDKLRRCRRREGRYLLRSNLTEQDPAQVWQKYLLLTQVEQAFKELKSDMSVRPIYHQKETRVEAHIFVSFLAYCLFVTLRNSLKPSANGLTSRSVFEVFQQMQMVDVHLPTTDGRTILLQRYTEPSPEVQLLLDRLGMRLPNQPPPRIYGQEENTM
jgi:transposase